MTFIGSKGWSTGRSEQWRASEPIAVSYGSGSGSRPSSSCASVIPTASPVAALSTYPSTPVICPAKKMRDSRRIRQKRSRWAGAWMYVLRWSIPYRTKTAFSRPGTFRKIRCCSGIFSLVWKPTRL